MGFCIFEAWRRFFSALVIFLTIYPLGRAVPATRKPSANGILLAICLAVFVAVSAAPSIANKVSEYQVLHVGNGLDIANTLSAPLGIFFDTHRNECYIADTGNHQVVVFDENGMPIHRFFHHVSQNGERVLGQPKSVAVNKGGRIFVVDAAADYLDVLDPLGRSIAAIDPPDDLCEQPDRFEYVTLGPDDRAYATVTCENTRKIVIIGPDLSVERIMRIPPMEDGDRVCPSAIGVDEAGRVYLTDPCASTMVQVYDKDSNYVMGFGRHDSGYENFSLPAGIAVMPSGEMWIVDTIRQIVSCFTPDGSFVSYVGGRGDQLGGLNYPSGLASDGKDRLFVVERAGNRYQCFRVLVDRPTAAGSEKSSDAMNTNLSGGR